MDFNLKLPYKKLPKEADGSDTKAADLTRIVLTRVIDAKYQHKMGSSESRMWGKILDEFADEKDVIEIDGSQFDFLKSAVDSTDMPPAFSSWLWVLREHLDEMKKDGGKESKAPRAVGAAAR